MYKNNGKTVYVGYFDLSKASDKVSRVRFLSNLIRFGVGMCMFEAVKLILLSDTFDISSGIKQGAASSGILFINVPR